MEQVCLHVRWIAYAGIVAGLCSPQPFTAAGAKQPFEVKTCILGKPAFGMPSSVAFVRMPSTSVLASPICAVPHMSHPALGKCLRSPFGLSY